MNLIKRFLQRLFIPETKDKGFYSIVRCHECGEEIRVRIEPATDFQLEYNPINSRHFYTINKEILGKNCFNLMRLKMALTKDTQILSTDTESCDFITFGRE